MRPISILEGSVLFLALCGCATSSGTARTAKAPAKGPTTRSMASTATAPPAPKVAPVDPDLARLVALAQGGPTLRDYPQADAVVALDRDDITLQKDGTVVEHHHSIVKLLDAQRGKRKYADVHIRYDKKRQTLRLDTARTVNADGVPHSAEADEIGDIVPPSVAGATIYSGVRERVVSFPAVDEGSVLELDFTRTTRPNPDAPMGGELLLGTWDPILNRTVTLTTPSGVTPKVSVQGISLQPTESTHDGERVWTYQLENQPDRRPEPHQPPAAAVLPRLVYGFEPSWGTVRKDLTARFLGAVPTKPSAEIENLDAKLTHGAKTKAEKARKLFAYVAHEVRSVNLPLGWAGYRPHAPSAVLANRYADQRDKVALLLAMYAGVGISGQPVLVRTGTVPVVSSVPTVAQFNRVLARVDLDGKTVWLDPTDEDGQFGVAFAGQDNLALPLGKQGEGLEHRARVDPKASVSHVTVKLALARDGDVDAKYRYRLEGYYADRASARLRPLKGKNLDRFFQREAAGISPSALDEGHHVGNTLSVSGPLRISQHVALPGYSVPQGRFRVIELPPVSFEIADDMPSPGLSRRTYPLMVAPPRVEKADVTLRLPRGWDVAYLPSALEGSAGGVRYASKCRKHGHTVRCHDEIALDALVVEPDQYAAFRNALTKLQAYQRRVVLLVKAGKRHPPKTQLR